MPSETASAAPREIELKLALSERDVERLRRRLAPWGTGRRMRVRSDYVDTPDRVLAGNGIALRLRRIGGRWVQTLKSRGKGGALSVRGEWETPLADPRLDLQHLSDTPAAPLLPLLEKAGRLAPLFRTAFQRTVWNVSYEGAQIEVAIDVGSIRARRGRHAVQIPILEAELELRSGEPTTLLALAEQLGRGRGAPALRPLLASKAERGYRLAAGAAAAPAKAGAAGFRDALPAAATTAQALRAVIVHGTHVLLANVDGLLADGNIEFVHQARVALRRMRSAARLLDRDAEDLPQSLRDEMQWIARVLGTTRDLDVVLHETLPQLAADDRELDAAAVARAAQRQRTRAWRALRAAAGTQRFAQLSLHLLQWSHSAPPKARRLSGVARRRLDRLRGRLLEEAAFFSALPATRRHHVRIRAKRLRYAIELLSGEFAADAVRPWTERLEALQDLLGAANDAAVASTTLRGLAVADATRRRAQRAARQRIQGSLIRTERALLQLAQAVPPWHAGPVPANPRSGEVPAV